MIPYFKDNLLNPDAQEKEEIPNYKFLAVEQIYKNTKTSKIDRRILKNIIDEKLLINEALIN